MKPPDQADEVPLSPRRRRRWWILMVLSVVVAASIWVLRDATSHNSATVLKDRSAFENRVAATMNRLPAGLRNLLRKIKGKVVGPAKLVLLDVFVVRFSEPPVIPDATSLAVEGGALRVLALQATNSDGFRDVLGTLKASQVLGSRQMSTFSGQLAQLSTFANLAPGVYEGHVVDVLPRARQGTIELAVHAEALAPALSDPGRPHGTLTNVMASVQVDLQPNTGVLVLPQLGSGASTGIFVLPTMFQLKR